MKKLVKTFLVIFLSLSFIHCGSDELQLTTDLIKSFRILDIGNNQNASDLFAVFTLEEPDQVQEIRLFLIASSDYASFNSQTAKNLDNGSFHIVDVANSNYQIQLPANLKDVNNNETQEDINYTLAIGLIMNGDLHMNGKVAQITLTNSTSINFIQTLNVLDISNEQNASDMFASFTIDYPNLVQEIRLLIIPSEDYASFDPANIQALNNNNFHPVAVGNSDYQTQLPANLNDVNNNAIQENVDYTFVVALKLNGDFFLNTAISQITLEDKHFLEGRYTGLWNDNLYTDFAISAELTFEDGKLSGDFFYSGIFSPCCGGVNDGIITLEIEDNVILEFIYDQELDSFMGGECLGMYNGTGFVEDFNVLKISYEGNDCEGIHSGGSIVLNKV